jgi:hypothetical protein
VTATIVEERDAAAQEGHALGTLLELLDDRDLALHRLTDRAVVEAQLGSRIPIADAWMPTRCSAELAFGETYSTCTARRATSRRRPLAAPRSSRRRRCGNGNDPAAIIDTKFSNTDP